MALEHHRFFGADLRPYLPLVRQSVRFFDEHYQLRQKMRTGKPLDDNGQARDLPVHLLRVLSRSRNPADLIAGLSACIEGLLALDDTLVPAGGESLLPRFLQRLPDYTYGEVEGDRMLLACGQLAALPKRRMPAVLSAVPLQPLRAGP